MILREQRTEGKYNLFVNICMCRVIGLVPGHKQYELKNLHFLVRVVFDEETELFARHYHSESVPPYFHSLLTTHLKVIKVRQSFWMLFHEVCKHLIFISLSFKQIIGELVQVKVAAHNLNG